MKEILTITGISSKEKYMKLLNLLHGYNFIWNTKLPLLDGYYFFYDGICLFLYDGYIIRHGGYNNESQCVNYDELIKDPKSFIDVKPWDYFSLEDII